MYPVTSMIEVYHQKTTLVPTTSVPSGKTWNCVTELSINDYSEKNLKFDLRDRKFCLQKYAVFKSQWKIFIISFLINLFFFMHKSLDFLIF